MPARRIRVLVVDDSLVIREVLRELLGTAPDIEVIGAAADGRAALRQLESDRPDLVTLDVHMPGMDGLATLEAILAREPVPVIMVSALTTAGATVTLDALDRGALDYVAKPDPAAGAFDAFGEELVRKIRWAAGVDVRRVLAARRRRKRPAEKGDRPQLPEQKGTVPVLRPRQPAEAVAAKVAQMCIAVGVSTGGPPALAVLFEALRPPLPPMVVVQHMPAAFTRPLAWRLDGRSQLSVKEAEAGDVLQPNRVLIAPGGRHLELRRAGPLVEVHLHDAPPLGGHRPSIDAMMRSAAKCFGLRCLGVIMTGMGRDGVEGCAAIRAAGGYVLGQDQASSDVYGMNKLAHEAGHVDRQFSLSAAAGVIAEALKHLAAEPAAAM